MGKEFLIISQEAQFVFEILEGFWYFEVDDGFCFLSCSIESQLRYIMTKGLQIRLDEMTFGEGYDIIRTSQDFETDIEM